MGESPALGTLLGAVGAGTRHQLLSGAFPGNPAHRPGPTARRLRLARPSARPRPSRLRRSAAASGRKAPGSAAARSPPRRPQQTPAAPPALDCAQPRPARGPTPQQGAVSAGRAGRGSLGLFACRWLPHPPSPAPEFLWFHPVKGEPDDWKEEPMGTDQSWVEPGPCHHLAVSRQPIF
ncbi:anther-specific proline-rich protein APG-like [Leopardus geoffroyi]|uniref:anther-specific proline-rich protein APG-like n=1 Tax=Leopardus geoffroyi TaxID=46844 RepID=UPI001E25F3C1|nr:anther-specific proline-rich protein APG-like [Leopardus geoffroyi]